MGDINKRTEQYPKGNKKKGFAQRTWKAVKRLFFRGKKTKVEPIVPPLLQDNFPSDLEITSISWASHLEHRPGGEHAASEPSLITDLSYPEQTEEEVSVCEESSDRGSVIHPGEIPDYLDLLTFTPASHEVNWALEVPKGSIVVKDQNKTYIKSTIASDSASQTSSYFEVWSGENVETESLTGVELHYSSDSREYSDAFSGSRAPPQDTVTYIPEEKHTMVKNEKKKKRICGFFGRAWKTGKNPFAHFFKTKVNTIVPPLQPDMSDMGSIQEYSCFDPTEGDIQSYYDFNFELGSGSFGTVYRATRRSDGQKVAIKFMSRRNNNSYVFIPGYSMPLVTDVGLMLLMKTPPKSSSVIQMFEWFESPRSIKIVMECPRFSICLYDYIQSHLRLTESIARIIISQVGQALQDCIDHGVFHCDVHSGNILINQDTLNIKLIDFGCGMVLQTTGYKTSKYNGARRCAPPELKTKPLFHAIPTNVWQLGLLLFHILEGHFPKHATDEDLSLDSNLTEECQDLFRQFLTPDPAKRPTLKQIFQHKWFSPRCQ